MAALTASPNAPTLAAMLRMTAATGLLLMGCIPLAPAARADIAATRGDRSLGTTVNGGDSCGRGSCRIGGGRTRGENLYQRLDRFDTRGGISDVLIENGSSKTVVMGVIGPGRTQITVPVSLQNRGGLMLMSPAGITVSPGGSFRNVSRLGLTNQTGLRVGSGALWFNALNSTAADLEAGAFDAPIRFDRDSLRTSQATLSGIGLSAPGEINISSTPGVELVVASTLLPAAPPPEPPHSVLIDAGQAALSLSDVGLNAGPSTSEATSPSLGLFGGSMAVNGSVLNASSPGLVNLQADRALNLDNSSLKGLKVGLRATTVTLKGTTMEAPRGLIQIDAANTIALEGSRLDVAPRSPEDLSSVGLGYVIQDPEFGAVVSVPALISLTTSAAASGSDSAASGIRISTSILDASSVVSGIPAESSTRQALIAGNIMISSSSDLTIENSLLSADADQNYAGQISALAQGPGSSLQLTKTTARASSPYGSGDVRLYSRGSLAVLDGTRLEANTRGAAFTSGTFLYNPPGEISLTNEGSAGLTIAGSTLQALYTFEQGLDAPFSFYSDDVLDFADNSPLYAPPGGLIRLISNSPISVRQLSTLDASSSTGVGGTIQVVSTSAGGIGIGLSNSQLVAKTSGPLPPEITSYFLGFPPEPYEGLRAGQIQLASPGDIEIDQSGLDTSLVNISQYYDAFTAEPGFKPLRPSITISSEANLNILNTSLNTSAPTGTSTLYESQGGSIDLAAAGAISYTGTPNISGDLDGSYTERTLATNEFSGYSAILESELGNPEQNPKAISQQIALKSSLENFEKDIFIITSDLSDIRAVVVDKSPGTETSAPQPITFNFDVTTDAGLGGLQDLLRQSGRDQNLDGNLINNLTSTLQERVREFRQKSITPNTDTIPTNTSTATPVPSSQLSLQNSLAPTKPAATDQSTLQKSQLALTSALAGLSPLTETQSAASLEEGEAASRDQLAAFLASGNTSPPVPTLAALQGMLRRAGQSGDGGQAAILRLSYAVDPQVGDSGEGSLDLVLVTAEGPPSGWRTTIQLTEFRNLLRSYYSDLAEQNLAMGSASPAGDASERRLFELLLRSPLQQLEQQRIGTLIISADPSLIDIPWNALHDGQRYLSQRFALAVTPSLAFTNLAAAAGGAGAGRMNAGASLFNNGLTPLPMVEKELAVLSAQPGQGQVTTLLNRQFNPTSFSSGFAAAGTRQVHIASHAEIAAGPQRIPTIYTGDAALSLRELGQLRQRSGAENLDLVTLSACRSALNGADLELGFAGLAVQLGAKTAIGTKWYVDDLATSTFFVLFYQQLQQGLSKAEALRATQQAFAGGQVRVEGTQVIGPSRTVLLAHLPESYQHRYTRGFSHPYYWAGVQLVGSPW